MTHEERAQAEGMRIYRRTLDAQRRRVDRLFIRLMLGQWAIGVAVALLVSPKAWEGASSSAHAHLWAAVFLGGLIASLPIYLAVYRSGEASTRQVVAVGQILTSALLIHLTGGRIETHFHVFGSLTILAFYRDWRVLATATAVVIADNGLRGFLWPESVYGTAGAQAWRFLEHAGWVLLQNSFLIYSINQGLRELRGMALSQAGESFASRRFSEERQRIQDQFLANVSHELRTPIASIKGYAETLRAEDDPALRREFLEIIEKNANRLGALVENLLDAASLEQSKLKAKPRRVALRDWLGDLALDFKPQMKARGLRLEVSADDDLAVHADADQLWGIMHNLIGNAAKFSPRGSTIKVRAATEGWRVRLSVSDQGPGIPASEHDLVFERFHSDRRGISSAGGAGLGLAIVKSLVELNGGLLELRSALGQGATFSVVLPSADSLSLTSSP